MEMCSHTPLIIKQSTIKSREELLGIRETVKHSNNLSQLQPVRLNRRKTCRSKRGRTEQSIRALKNRYPKTERTQNNLVKIKSLPSVEHNVSINYFTVNARSLLNKAIDVRNFMCERKCVFGVITETWFDNSKSHDWELCDLNVNGFKLSSVCRSKGRGGGLAFIYRDNCIVENLKKKKLLK